MPRLAQGRSLNHASLAVTDVQKAADFYGRLFNAQLYIQAFDNHRLQVGPHGYQG